MKVLIDLDRALAQGRITPDEHGRLKSLSGTQTSDLALGILIGFGIIAVAIGFLAMSGSVYAPAGIGLALGGAGAGLLLRGGERRRLLGQILLVVGTVLLAGGLVMLDGASQRSVLYAVAVLTASAVLVENGLLAALAVLALSGALGASGSYEHASYTLAVERPAETIGVFAALGAALLFASARLSSGKERIALIAARTAALLVAFGFMVGSLWGDTIRDVAISRGAFALAWAVVLCGAAAWAWRHNRRWPLVTATVFGAIHFYTQWFERIGSEPAAILFAGLLAIAIGYGLKQVLSAMPPGDASAMPAG